jgi:hypothetical protein
MYVCTLHYGVEFGGLGLGDLVGACGPDATKWHVHRRRHTPYHMISVGVFPSSFGWHDTNE